MDIRQSPQHAAYLRSIGWIIEHIPTTQKHRPIQVYLLRIPVLNWHFAKLQRYSYCPEEQALRKLFRKYHVFAFSFEPGMMSEIENKKHEALMKKFRGKIDSSVYVPSATQILDLTKPISELRADFDANARRLTRPQIHQQIDTIIKPVTEWPQESIQKFWDAGRATNKHWHLTRNLFERLVEHYQSKAHFAVSMDASSKEWLSGILLLNTPDQLNYFQAWAGKKARKNGAHFWTVFKSLEYGKKIGCKIFDFEGMYDARFPRKSWRGFSNFKSKFGGEFVKFPGCFTRFHLLAPFFW